MARESSFWHADKNTCIELIWKDYEENGRYPQMLRHFYYVLLLNEALRIYPKTGKTDPQLLAYHWVSQLLVEARETGAFPWHGIIDSGRRAITRYRGKRLQEFSDAARKPIIGLIPGARKNVV